MLRGPGAPLHDVDVVLRHTPYDWNDPSTLANVLRDGRTVMVGSSEGGLFEYGTNEAIVSNLQCLATCTREDFVMIGSVTRADEPIQRLQQMPHAAVGWHVARAIERPFSDQVVLARRT